MLDMSARMDITTVERASQETGVSMGTLGYWIIAGMLEANVTPEGRVVRLSDVRHIAGQLGAPSSRRELLIQPDRASDAGARVAAQREGLLHEVQARLERLDQQLQRVDQALTGQVGQLDRLEAARNRDADALARVETTLQQHAEALRRLETGRQPASTLPGAPLAAAADAEPPLVLRFRQIAPSPAQPAAPAPSLRMRDISTTPRPAAAPQSAASFARRFALPKLPFAGRKPVGDNS
jgi:hypothetical protein